jgi:hypothetical protein
VVLRPQLGERANPALLWRVSVQMIFRLSNRKLATVNSTDSLQAQLSIRSLMKFAKLVYWIAGIWGLLAITPLYFMFNLIGQKDPPPITHPGFYYGFAGTALAWQIAFLFIAQDPVRLRPMMIPSIVEKFAYAGAVVVLVAQGRMRPSDLVFAGTDGLLGLLFVIAYIKTAFFPAEESQSAVPLAHH